MPLSNRAALGWSKRQRLLPDVVEDVHALLLVVAERAHRTVGIVPHREAPQAGVRDHIALCREHHVCAIEVGSVTRDATAARTCWYAALTSDAIVVPESMMSPPVPSALRANALGGMESAVEPSDKPVRLR
jgi:hypothetical protein